MTQHSKHSKVLVYTVAVIGIFMQLSAIVLMLGWGVSVALAMPPLIVGMFMTFTPILILARKSTSSNSTAIPPSAKGGNGHAEPDDAGNDRKGT